MDRIEVLKSYLLENEADTFALYGLAMEYKGLHNWPVAIDYFKKVVEHEPQHAAAWFQMGQIYAAQNEFTLAEQAYASGMHAAEHSGNQKLKREIESYWNAL